ncbi:MAG: PAS domain S-box protein [bacterium]|nr:PAS domain S-box protein [bacterium]
MRKTEKEFEILKNEIEEYFLKHEFLKNICSIVSDGFCVKYKDKIIFCNDRYAEILGYKKEELIGTEILNFCSEKEIKFWDRILKEEVEDEFETKFSKRDGSEIWVKVKNKNIKYKDKILRISIISDITEEKISFLKIKESEDKYKILTETLLDGIIVVDINGTILFSNVIGANLFGFEEVHNFIKKNIFDFIVNKEELEKHIKLLIKNKGGYFIEHEIRDNKGSKYFIEMIGRKINFMDRESILFCFRDVTERRIIIENLKEAVGSSKKMLNQAVTALSEILTYRDPYTYDHQKRVAKLAIEIAKEFGFSESLVEGVGIISLLHDIGKIYIPMDILTKPKELTSIEWEFIKMHPEYGANIVKKIEFPWRVSESIYQHHERLNGSGYPLGLKGKSIIFEARILSVADVVEAMSSHRPYRPKHTIEETFEELRRNSGILYDKEVVETTLKIFKKGFSF